MTASTQRRSPRYSLPRSSATFPSPHRGFLSRLLPSGEADAAVIDVSPFGMQIFTREPILQGDTIDFSLRVSLLKDLLRVRGVLRYVLPVDLGTDGKGWNAGVKFVHYGGDAKERLRRVCAAEWIQMYRREPARP